MKISEVTLETVKKYLKVDDDTEDAVITGILSAATTYILKYTGIESSSLDNYDDLTIALLVLCSDMFDNRQMTVVSDKVNRVVQSILDMHCLNFL